MDEAAGVEHPAGVDVGPLADDPVGDGGAAGMDVDAAVGVARSRARPVYAVQARIRITVFDSLVRELLDPSRHVPYGDPSA